MNHNQRKNDDKLSMGLSVFIALCVVSVFCVLSIIVVENLDVITQNKSKHVTLKSSKELSDFII